MKLYIGYVYNHLSYIYIEYTMSIKIYKNITFTYVIKKYCFWQ